MTRQTTQKSIINKELSSFNSFFSAEELLSKVKSKGIGIATVYRFLKETEKRHELHSYTCNRRTLYSRNHHSHSHFICERCNDVIHFNVDSIDSIAKKIKGSICHFQIEVHGICDNCKK